MKRYTFYLTHDYVVILTAWFTFDDEEYKLTSGDGVVTHINRDQVLYFEERALTPQS